MYNEFCAFKAPIVEQIHLQTASHEGCQLPKAVRRFVGLAQAIKSIANIHIIVDY